MLTVLGLGSNIGNRLEYLQQAIWCLQESGLTAIELSPAYESRAVLPDKAPKSWDVPFLNMAVRGETHLSPEALLNQVKHIERKLGRQQRGLWGPREVDIDILVYEDVVVKTADLIIPHKYLAERAFALIPLADVAPNWRFPQGTCHAGKTAFEMAAPCRHSDAICKTDLPLERRRPSIAA